MDKAKICTCGETMKSRGIKYLSISDSRLFAGAMIMQEDVEVFVCPNCRRLEFYAVEPYVQDTQSAEQKLYELYKTESDDKLNKMLQSGKYTDECKAVIRKILSERE